MAEFSTAELFAAPWRLILPREVSFNSSLNLQLTHNLLFYKVSGIYYYFTYFNTEIIFFLINSTSF